MGPRVLINGTRYYTSNIGIHDELKYQGNVYIDEFIGTDISSPIGGQKK